MAEIFAKPSWASWAEDLGRVVAAQPTSEVGQDALRIALSVPTGQFLPWLIAGGALSLTPSVHDEINSDKKYSTWVSWNKRMGDSGFNETTNPTRFEFDKHPLQKIDSTLHPVREIPADTPTDRGGAGPAIDLKEKLKHLPGREYTWHTWYASQCLSPVVIIGDGREYLQLQREEILRKAPHWFTDESLSLLSEDSGQTSNPERMYFHPFMVFRSEVGQERPWLRAMKPRLVIVTSWTSYNAPRRHPSLFAGAPHIILTNRRVASAIDASSSLSNEAQVPIPGLPATPPGIFLRSFSKVVTTDSGDDDELEIEI